MTTFETKQEIEKQDPISHVLEKQTKEFEDFSKRMSLEFQSSYQEYLQQNLRKLHSGECSTCKCREKDGLINSLKARIEELEKDSHIKSQDIKKLQEKVQSLFDIIAKKDTANIEEFDTIPTKITVTTELGEEIYDSESTKPPLPSISSVGVNVEIEKDKLSVECYDDIRDSYSESAVDMFSDDDSSTKTDNYEDSNYYSKYDDRPSEWLDLSPTFNQRAKVDKRNLDRWNSKMANDGLLPIRLVGKVDMEREKKYQTHRKRYSTSAIWLKTYESRQKQDQQNQQNHDEKFKIPSFNFKLKPKESKELSAPISLKSSACTSICDLYTTSLPSTSSQSYEVLEHHKNTPLRYSKSQQMLSQYK